MPLYMNVVAREHLNAISVHRLMKYFQQEQLCYLIELVVDALCSAPYTIAMLPSQERNDSE